MEKPVSAQAGQLVTLAAKQAVAPSAVEDNLAELWRRASEESRRGGGGNVIRACLWNLLVYNPRPQKKFKDVLGHGYGLRSLLDEVILSTPARIIRLEFAQGKGDLPKGRDSMAWVAAKCVDQGGKRHIYGEVVNLQVHAKGGDSHFPSLVRALLQPSMPIALLGLDDLPHEGWMLEQLLQLCDRVLVDTQSPEYSGDLRKVAGYLKTTDAYIVDVGWMRLAPLRYLVAGFFDPPGKPAHLKKIESIVVQTTPAGRNSGHLLLGWLLSRTGHGRFTSESGKQGGSESGKKGKYERKVKARYRWQVGTGKKRFPAELVITSGNGRDGGVDGVLQVEIRAGGHLYRVRDVDSSHVSLESPHRNDPHVALNGWRDSELVIAGLGAHGIDRVYVEALECAAELIEVQSR